MDSVIVFYNDRARFCLDLALALDRISLRAWRELFQLMLTDTDPLCRNRLAIETTQELLKDRAAKAKSRWADASAAYTMGYINTRFDWCKDIREAERNNRKLTASVKSTKRAYDRANKQLTVFQDLKAKYYNV